MPAAMPNTNAHFVDLLQNLQTGVVVHGADTHIIFSNTRASELLGLSEDQMRGKVAIDPTWSFVDEFGNPMLPSAYPVSVVVSTLAPLKALVLGVKAPHREQIVWLLVSAFPKFDAGGGLQQIIVNFYDITERKLLADQQRLSDLALKAISQGVLVTDANRNIVSANDAFEAITGYHFHEVVGRNCRFLQGPATHPDTVDAIRAALQSHSEFSGEILNYRQDGTPFWNDLTISPAYNEAGVVTHFIGITRDISERKQAEETIRELNRDFVSFLENTGDFVYFKDAQSRFRFCSQTLATITGHPSWRDMIGKHDLEVFPEDTARIYYEEELPIFSGGQPLLEKIDPYYDAQGNKGWVSTNKWPVRDTDGVIVGLFGMSRDVTQQVEAQEKLSLAASVFTHAMEGILITTPDGTIVDVNAAFTRITGYEREEVIGLNPRILGSGRQDQDFYANLWDELIRLGHWSGEIWNRRKNGEPYAQMQTISAIRDDKGQTRHYVALFSDITAIKDYERELEHIAHYDALTQLPNRTLLADRLRQGMLQAVRRNQLLAVVYLDLDGFKEVNDHHGHQAGDRLLTVLSAEMKHALREGDTLARVGGDEFVAVLLDLDTAMASKPLLNRLLHAASRAVLLENGYEVEVSASFGVTLYPQNEEVDAEQLLRQADQAMYQAKVAGKNRFHFFDAEQDRFVRGHHESLERIRRALAHQEFVLFYQPKVNMRTRELVGVEALIRWQHPQKGLLAPIEFLPIIEDHPLAIDIGDWVIDTALSQIETWQASGLVVPVSVNVSARQLQDARFVESVKAALARHPLVQPGNLSFEVLETSALDDLAMVSGLIQTCKNLGVPFALDDFGTGYSSLTYLKRLPVSQLKIDQSFVRDMLSDADDLAILEGVLSLAKAFRREVIAEGVETIEHGRFLLQLGCDLGQGYGIARPMPADKLLAWVDAWRCEAAWKMTA